MIANPFLGVVLHAIGGVAHGCFYAPLRKLRQWRWETGWLVQGLAAWVITPWIVAELTGTHPLTVLQQSWLVPLLPSTWPIVPQEPKASMMPAAGLMAFVESPVSQQAPLSQPMASWQLPLLIGT